MPSLLPGYEYDIFISYRQNDNRSGWVSQFVADLRKELAATVKEPINIYFDENPHDGLQDTHHVDKSLEGKLKCLIFIPVLSHTYCDANSFAWNNEFLPFCKLASDDALGLHVKLLNGNVASRVMPVQVHDLAPTDQQLFERSLGSPLRSIDFIFRNAGINRPLSNEDTRAENQSRILYRDQINKTANAIDSLIRSCALANKVVQEPKTENIVVDHTPPQLATHPSGWLEWFWRELLRRNVFRAALTYLIVSLLVVQLLAVLGPYVQVTEQEIRAAAMLLIAGFPVAIVMAWLYEISPHGLIRTTSAQAFENPYPPYKKKPLTSGPMIVVLAIAVSVMALYVILMTSTKEPKPQITIGILAFESRSERESDRYIAEGLTDDIINRLIIISQFRVTSDTKPRPPGETQNTASIVDVARKLDASLLLTGSVQRTGNSITIRARLFDIGKQSYIWGGTYDRTLSTLVEVQSEIVEAIAEQLHVDLDTTEELRLTTKATESPTAYDFYLRGKSLYLRYNGEANDSAVMMFKMAIAKDPNYARAWSGLGDAYSQMYRFGYDYSWNDSSIKAGTRAIELDSLLSDAYKAVANAYNGMRLYDKALPYLQKAVELNRRNYAAIGNLGTNYFFRGELPEALRLQKQSAQINPTGFVPYQIAGWIYARLGDYKKAEEWFLESIKLKPDFAQTYELLAYTYIAQGKKREALAIIDSIMNIKPQGYRNIERSGVIAHYCGELALAMKYYELAIEKNPNFASDPNSLSAVGLGQLLAQQGNNVRSEVLLSHALDLNQLEIERGSQDDDPRYLIAAVYAIRGNTKESVAWLKKAIDMQWLDYDQIAFNPWFDSLRKDQEYTDLMKALKKRLEAMRKQVE